MKWNRARTHRAFGVLALLGIAVAFMSVALAQAPARPVHAAPAGLNMVVNNTADLPDPDASHPICATASTQCTLRAAIQDANFASGPSTITVPAGTYVLTRPGYDDSALVGDLDIVHDLTLQGAGSGATIVDGNGAVTGDRVFQVLSSVNALNLSGLTIRNGQSLSSTVGVIGGGGLYIEGKGQVQLTDVIVENNTGLNGGGVYANFTAQGGALTMDRVLVSANVVTGTGLGAGGGVYAYIPSSFSAVTVRDSQVYSNSTDGTGGGFYVTGNSVDQWSIQRSEIYSNTAQSGGAIGNSVPLALSDSRVHDNHAVYDGGAIEAFSPLVIARTAVDANSAGRFGGAIFDLSDYANPAYKDFAHIVESTLSGNYAPYGAAIYHDGYFTPLSRLTLMNSTVSGNLSSNRGGGIYVYSGHAQLLNTTVVGNVVHPPLGVTGLGGGVYITASATFTAYSSLLAWNIVRYTIISWHHDDCYSSGTVGSLAYNLIQTNTNCFVTGGQIGNIIGQDPLLGPLAYNGGSTRTQALLPGSPAIDAGMFTGCIDDAGNPLTTDQRGFPRPIKGSTSLRCDIGAYEYYPDALFLPLVRR